MSDYYSELALHRESAWRDGWRHRLEQWLRFEIILRGLQIEEGSRIVDLGCGTGQLYAYATNRFSVGYVGVDRFEPSIASAQRSLEGGDFLCADLFDEEVDKRRPFDFAVAIGTMVDGEEGSPKEGRLERLTRLIARLNQLGKKGWALVVLNQEVLDADPVRSLEPCLAGATVEEIEYAVHSCEANAVISDQVLPTDLFVLSHDTIEEGEILSMLTGDAAHEEVLHRHRETGDSDSCDEAWLWLISGREERARRALHKILDGNPRKEILVERLAAFSSS